MKRLVLLLMVALIWSGVSVSAANIKVAIVDLNRALNESEEGARIRNMLEIKHKKSMQDLKTEEDDLKKLEDDLKNNTLLKADAKQQKQQDFENRVQTFSQKQNEYRNVVRKDEQQFTQELFQDLKISIRSIALQEKMDVVLEKNVYSQVLLFTQDEPIDLTQKVIDHFNSLKASAAKKK